MTRLAGWFRFLVLWTLLLQPAALAAVRLGHIPQEARTLGHNEHIGVPGEGACVPHSDVVCQTCRGLHAALHVPSVRDRHEAPASFRCVHHIEDSEVVAVRPPSLPLGSRAPPVR